MIYYYSRRTCWVTISSNLSIVMISINWCPYLTTPPLTTHVETMLHMPLLNLVQRKMVSQDVSITLRTLTMDFWPLNYNIPSSTLSTSHKLVTCHHWPCMHFWPPNNNILSLTVSTFREWAIIDQAWTSDLQIIIFLDRLYLHRVNLLV